MTEEEIILWSRLKSKQVLQCKFRRQYSVGKYVLDFYCPEKKLAIELDGGGHFTEDAKKYDDGRQACIEGLGIRFLRFTNRDVRENLHAVLEEIFAALNS